MSLFALSNSKHRQKYRSISKFRRDVRIEVLFKLINNTFHSTYSSSVFDNLMSKRVTALNEYTLLISQQKRIDNG